MVFMLSLMLFMLHICAERQIKCTLLLESPTAFPLYHKFCCNSEESSKLLCLMWAVWIAELCLASLLPLICYFCLTHFCQALHSILLLFSSVPAAIYIAVSEAVSISGFQNWSASLLLWQIGMLWGVVHHFLRHSLASPCDNPCCSSQVMWSSLRSPRL